MSNKAPPQPGTSATIALSEQPIARAQPNQGLPLDSAQLTPPVTLEADATTAPAHITSGHCDNGDENDDDNDRTNRPQSGSVNVTIKPHGRSSDAGSVNIRKTEKRLLRETGRAIADFRMIEQGDSIMVCLSGGKDSYTLLNLLLKLQKKAPVNFRLVAVNMDQKQPGFPTHILPDYLNGLGVEWDVIEQDTYSTVKRVVAEGKTMCGLCSRLRRGTLYGYAHANGFNKIALGHHRDDIIETFFLNLFHGGSLKAMPPKLRSDDGRNTVIRPLAYCRESDIERFAKHHQFPIIPCNLCGSQTHLQRVATKKMLAQWQQQFPGRIESIFRALGNVSPSQLADRTLFDFDNFKRVGQETLDAAESEAAADAEPESTDAKQWVHLSDRS